MILLNINEEKVYSYKEGFIEIILNEMFGEYFNELYQESVAKIRTKEIWREISMEIPERAIFVEKDTILYTLSRDLKFEVVPKEFFKMKRVSHNIFFECFTKCYSKFKSFLENYRECADEQIIEGVSNVYNIYLDTLKVEDLSKTLRNAENVFADILGITLKEKLINIVLPKIVTEYERVLLKEKPIMLITKEHSEFEKVYAVMGDLSTKEVDYSIMEEELENIISEVIPEDTDFLVNRLYNFIISHNMEVRSCIRITEIKKEGLIAKIFSNEGSIPIVGDLDMKTFYAFVKNNHRQEFLPNVYIKYSNDKIPVDIKHNYLRLNSIIEKMKKINKTMFDKISCYVECYEERYRKELAGYQIAGVLDFENPVLSPKRRGFMGTGKFVDTQYNILYKLNKGKLLQCTVPVGYIDEQVDEFLEAEYKKAYKNGCYSFWEIRFDSE